MLRATCASDAQIVNAGAARQSAPAMTRVRLLHERRRTQHCVEKERTSVVRMLVWFLLHHPSILSFVTGISTHSDASGFDITLEPTSPGLHKGYTAQIVSTRIAFRVIASSAQHEALLSSSTRTHSLYTFKEHRHARLTAIEEAALREPAGAAAATVRSVDVGAGSVGRVVEAAGTRVSETLGAQPAGRTDWRCLR
jgi:hypothetical protein